MVRWACRDERFDDALGRAPNAGPGDEDVAGVTLTGGVRGGTGVLAFVDERRKLRAGEGGEGDAGSGASQTNEAAETVGSAGGAAGAGSGRSVSVPSIVVSSGHPVPLDPGGDSSAGARPPPGVAIDDHKPSSPSVQSSSASGATGAAAGRLKLAEFRGVPMVSAGSAGTSLAASFSSATAPPLAGPPLARTPLADPPLGRAELPLARTSLAAAAARATFARAARTGEVAMIWVSSSVSAIRSSSSCGAVTTVGEAPPEPSAVFVRLSKPSSYDLTLMRLSLSGTPKGHSRQEDGLVPRLRDNADTG